MDEEDKDAVVNPDGNCGNPNTTIINESGLYSLILSSKMPNAKEFKRWVTSEVNDEPFFVGKDVAEILGVQKAGKCA